MYLKFVLRIIMPQLFTINHGVGQFIISFWYKKIEIIKSFPAFASMPFSSNWIAPFSIDYRLWTTKSIGLKSKVKSTHPPTLSPSLTRDPISTLWDHGWTHQTPEQQYIPPKWSIFPKHPQLWVTTGSFGLKSKVKPPAHPPHPLASPETPYQHSGTTGGPIRPTKQ